MGEISKPISNLPLTAPATPGMLREIKGCRFEPAVWLSREKFYLIVVTHYDPKTYRTIPGFYDVPDKGVVAFIVRFRPIQVSSISVAGMKAIVFEAIEGTPPIDWTPDKQFDFRKYRLESFAIQAQKREERLNG